MLADLTYPVQPDTLTRAADHISRVGLAKDDYVDLRGSQSLADSSVCTAGAVSWALTGDAQPDSDMPAEFAAALHFISGHLPGEPGIDDESGEPDYLNHIAYWNDAPKRTAGEVVSLLRQLALEVAA